MVVYRYADYKKSINGYFPGTRPVEKRIQEKSRSRGDIVDISPEARMKYNKTKYIKSKGAELAFISSNPVPDNKIMMNIQAEGMFRNERLKEIKDLVRNKNYDFNDYDVLSDVAEKMTAL